MAKAQQEKWQESFAFTTDRGIAGWTWLNEPDTKHDQNGPGNYNVELFLPPTAKFSVVNDDGERESIDCLTFLAKLDELHDGAFAHAKKTVKPKRGQEITSMSRPWGLVEAEDADEDENLREHVGKFRIRAKMKAGYVDKKTNELREMKPTFFDGKKKVLGGKGNPPLPRIGRGSILRINCNAAQYISGTNAGATIYLTAVQVISAKAGFGRDADSCGFDEEPDAESFDDGGNSPSDDSGDVEMDE